MSWLFPSLSGPQERAPGLRPALATIAGATAVHAGVLILLLAFVPTHTLVELARPLAVRLVELAPEAPPPAPPPPRKPPPRARPADLPPPVIATTTPAPADTSSFVVPPQPPAPPAPAAVPPAPTLAPPVPPAPITAARFDAAYLNNPKPDYPPAARRFGEEGKVVLRVHVDAEGRAAEVVVRDSSGYPRLDAAARDAVVRWRFVPARRGEERIPDWVLVPIVFSLEG